MPAIGISNLYDYTEPVGLILEELELETTIDSRTIRDKSGETVKAGTLGFKRVQRTAKGRGNEDLAIVTAGAFTEGTFKVVTVKNGATNDHYSTFEQTAKKFENLDAGGGEED